MPVTITPLQVAIADIGDLSVANAIRTATEYLRIGIANTISITVVQTVVIGGGASALGEGP